MKKIQSNYLTYAVAAGVIAFGGLSASAQTLMLQLQAANYNAATGVWTDTSANFDNATWNGTAGTAPTLVAGATPSGASAVNFGSGTSGDWFNLTSAIASPGSTGYTIFAVLLPSAPTSDTGRQALTAGSSGSLEYNIYQGHQDALVEYTSDPGHGTGSLSTSGFSLIDVAISSSGGAYRLNGSADGTASGTSYSPGISIIGNNHGGGDYLEGELAEIDIYTGVLSPTQISGVESTLTSEYLTPAPEPTTLAMTAGGFGLLLIARGFRRSRV